MRQRARALVETHAGHDHAAPRDKIRRQSRLLCKLRRGARRQREKLLPVHRPGQPLRRAIRDRRQGIAKRRVQMHRAAVERAPDRMPQRLAQIAQRLRARLRHRELMIKRHKTAEELLLVDGLPRGTVAHFRRTVGGDDEQRRAALLRLDHRRQVVGPGRAAGAEQHHRRAGALGDAEPEKRRRALVQHRRGRDARVRHQRHGERRVARAGRDDRVPHARAPQRLRRHRAPQRVRVSKIKGHAPEVLPTKHTK